ncbi:hypothetical protein ATANTOWER_028054 [Ataeniobius toweri]|uniref:Uncharacterized protein n=1 Tax=Ataeniobius toweri TaxID=208326 RepID=A0ABU7CJA9_9TELE|nr:hypothetical protein [Ataeniobius toweri]
MEEWVKITMNHLLNLTERLSRRVEPVIAAKFICVDVNRAIALQLKQLFGDFLEEVVLVRFQTNSRGVRSWCECDPTSI